MHEEALTERGKELFPRLGKFDGFYLAGGTALALQIGHRKSVDFDLFTEEALPERILQKVKQVFDDATVVTTYNVPGQLNIFIDNVKSTFFQYEYPVVEPFVMYKNVPLASIREIAAMKAFSIGKRLSYKDYIDWYFLLSEQHVALPDVITLAQQKFKNDFNDRLFLSQLASFEDIEDLPIDFLRDAVDRSIVENFLAAYIKNSL